MDLRLLLVLTPNILIVATLLSWLLTAFDVLRKRYYPKTYWLMQTTVALLLPQLNSYWPRRLLVRYLPAALFPFLDTVRLYPWIRTACVCLPAIAALATALVVRRASTYILLAGGAIYIAFVFVILFLFKGGAVA